MNLPFGKKTLAAVKRSKVVKYAIAQLILIALVASSCRHDPLDGVDLMDVSQDNTPYELKIPEEFPEMRIPEDNPMTVSGVELGRHLFHDNILSVDNSIACVDCHLKNHLFSDPDKVSVGVEGRTGSRQAMSVLNVGFVEHGLFWDGRAATLEELSLMPVEDPNEMAHKWSDLEQILQDHEEYPEMFARAFGIDDRSEITRDLAAKALAQYMRALVTTADSRWDRYNREETFFLTDLEFDGFQLFNDIGIDITDAECFHCHEGALLDSREYFNNGLDPADSSLVFDDLGRYNVTGYFFDRGKFRAPSLRNIEFTAPYMHDGRFETLEEVIDHYSGGGHFAPNIDPNIAPDAVPEFTEDEKEALLAFLKCFSDTSFLSQDIFQDPFE